MANVFTFNPKDPNEDFNKDDANYQLASVAYVCSLIKKLSDVLENHINDLSAHSFNDSKRSVDINTTESINIQDLELETSIEVPTAKDISTDSKHRFISDSQLNILKDKPSVIDMEAAIMNLRNEFKSSLSSIYEELLNMPNALQKLQDISYLLKTDDKVNESITNINSKVDKDEFNNHTNSAYHLNNNDRKALNLLISFIEKGCADWNATEDDANYIRNKPEKLPADGGNATTVGGFTAYDLHNHQLDDTVIGIRGNGYDDSSVDVMLTEQFNDQVIKSIASFKKGTYAFKSGIYAFRSFNLDKYDGDEDRVHGYTIRGCDNYNTFFVSTSIVINDNVYIENLCFSNSNVEIRGHCTFNNVRFSRCVVTFSNCDETTVTNCIFRKCTIIFNGICMNSIITGNRFIDSGYPRYRTNTNIINNNLFY